MPEAAEDFAQELVSPWICLGERLYPLEGIGQVAAASAGYGKLGHRPVPGLQDSDPQVWPQARQFRRAEASRSTSSYYYDIAHVVNIRNKVLIRTPYVWKTIEFWLSLRYTKTSPYG
jgi:hypothetical protein